MLSNMRVPNIIIFHSWFEDFEKYKLSDEQVGKLIRAIGRWKNGDELTCDDDFIRGILVGYSKNLNDMVDNYNNKVEKNRENGRKGGRPRKTQNNPLGYLETQKTHSVLEKPKETQHNPKNLKEKDKEKEKEKDKDISTGIEHLDTGRNIFVEVDCFWNKKDYLSAWKQGKRTKLDGIEITNENLDEVCLFD